MLYESYKIKNFVLKNRAVMPPMCMYSADEQGYANDFHLVHYGSRAIGGVGLIIQEATAVSPDGRISIHDLGIWDDSHIPGLKRIVDVIHQNGAVAGIQINHAGRKSKTENPIAPSAINYGGDYKAPREMTKKDIKEVVESFKQSARRANEAGYDLLEIHGAHGYLIFEFLSPLSNQRDDEYKDGTLFLKEVVEAITSVWPKEKILAIRISAYEYVEGGVTPKTISEAINSVKHLGIDIVDVSSGGNIQVKINAFPGYQLDLAKMVRRETKLPVMGGGLITDLKLADHAIGSNRCDLVYFGRVLLRDPYLILNHADDLGIDIEFPEQYIRGKK
ncbi:NADH:flavin oxidoreductase/NADH oxidase [Peloplasma aerotolerans]|jgi:NADPH2 dehydrogenase|uniref:NADH:flavin oxidoreductase/NADH oxidase n=1 Tax=Peloplasma aerotolerans TaxID=3044389 RepID=A0AAW6UD73_9MOLU|nr:NADH:flavin oxidoreductase/NADH oxidase [Mariniplasma sp. M4Ah]MDI6453594.1 NADH:flavin oxidoreductase/NADH oxidase [Mariniplasma sp. M4Ah]